jgi:uncharacterized membrane protein
MRSLAIWLLIFAGYLFVAAGLLRAAVQFVNEFTRAAGL